MPAISMRLAALKRPILGSRSYHLITLRPSRQRRWVTYSHTDLTANEPELYNRFLA